jgi:hypothetical protein
MQLPVAIRSQRSKVVGMRSARFAPVHLSPTSTGDKFLGRPANRFYASPAVCYQQVDEGHPSQFQAYSFGFRCVCGVVFQKCSSVIFLSSSQNIVGSPKPIAGTSDNYITIPEMRRKWTFDDLN